MHTYFSVGTFNEVPFYIFWAIKLLEEISIHLFPKQNLFLDFNPLAAHRPSYDGQVARISF